MSPGEDLLSQAMLTGWGQQREPLRLPTPGGCHPPPSKTRVRQEQSRRAPGPPTPSPHTCVGHPD